MNNYFPIAVIVALIFVSQTAYSQSRVTQICTGGVRNSAAIYFPQPEYPKEAKEKNISGVVNVRVSIDEEGNVSSAKACSGHPLLRPEAEKAAMKAKFKPTMLSGQPVGVFGVLVYNFKLNEEKISKGGIVNAKATSLPKPDYPQEAKDFCADGKVEVEVLIGEAGNVISAKAISGDELLQKSAVNAAKKAKFRQTIDVPPIKVKGIIVYNFDSFAKCLNAGIVNKKALNIPKPNIANLNHPKHFQIKEEQIVVVQIIIDESGKVVRTRAISGHPLLRGACENSALQTTFKPFFFDGAKIKIKAFLVYKFQTDGTIDTADGTIDTDVGSNDHEGLEKSFQPIREIDKTKKPVIINHLPPDSKPLFSPQPEYPAAARFVNVSGKVTVQILIDENGNIEKAKAISGHPLLRSAAEKAAKQIKFKPITLSGTPVKVRSLIAYTFTP